ncbi:hypothetical protein U3A55_05740 [Salarchaeum sp. III]|uniref:hypothetical protein n=1 Tax=Salarchaeum sp. III TaxID=3107927 RepID=UPI002ED7A07D
MKLLGSAVVGTAGLSTTVSAEPDGVSVSELGLLKEYNKLMDSFKFEEARDLLRKNDVEFSTRRYTRNKSSGGVSTESYYGKSQSSATFDVFLFNEETQEYGLVLTWNLQDVQTGIDLPQPTDRAAISYTPDGFIYTDDSIRHAGEIEIGDTNYRELTEVVVEPPVDSYSGAAVSFDDTIADPNASGSGFLQIQVKRDENGTGSGNVGGVYSHAWAPFGVGGTVAPKHSVSITAGAISIDLSAFAGRWELPSQDNRDQPL